MKRPDREDPIIDLVEFTSPVFRPFCNSLDHSVEVSQDAQIIEAWAAADRPRCQPHRSRSCTIRSLIGLISIPATLNGILRNPDRNHQQENRNPQSQSPTEKYECLADNCLSVNPPPPAAGAHSPAIHNHELTAPITTISWPCLPI
jgi:hypothetical protein